MVTKTLMKLAPEGGAGKVNNLKTGFRVAASGAGFDVIMRAADGLALGGTLQRFAIPVPFVGVTFSLIDLANYLAHSGGKIVPKSTKPFIAVGSAKFVQGSFSLSNIRLGTGSGDGSTGSGSRPPETGGGV